MANTKIINLKRYSKKRVPKKVLKGGADGDSPRGVDLDPGEIPGRTQKIAARRRNNRSFRR